MALVIEFMKAIWLGMKKMKREQALAIVLGLKYE